MTAFSRLALVALSLPAVAALVGCGVGPGAFVSWSFEGLSRCDTAGITALDVLIYDDEGQEHFRGEVACLDGPVPFALAPGSYTLLAEAVAWNDVHPFAGGVHFVVEDGVPTDLGTLDLGRTSEFGTADLVLAWSFQGLSDCRMAGVAEVVVTVGGSSSSSVRHHQRWPCTGEGVFIPELDAGMAEVELEALDASGRTLYRADAAQNLLADDVCRMGKVDLAAVE